MQRKSVTFRDVIESLEKIHRFVSFGEKLGKAIFSLAKAGVDVNRLNPMDFQSILQLATSLRSKGYDLDDIDFEELKQEFEEILDMDLNEIRRSITIIQRYCSISRMATNVLKTASKSMPANPEAVSNVMAMFGLQPKTETTESTEEEEIEETELTEEDIKDFREVIDIYRKRKG